MSVDPATSWRYTQSNIEVVVDHPGCAWQESLRNLKGGCKGEGKSE